MKRRKSTTITIAFLIYVTVVSAYLAPRNTHIGTYDKIGVIIGSYVIVFALWMVLRRKEKLQAEYRERTKNDNEKIEKKQ